MMRRLVTTAAIAMGVLAAQQHGALAQQADPAQGPAQPKSPMLVAQNTPADPTAAAAPATCTGEVDPYKNYACLDTYLGTGVFERFLNYYKLEWGQAGPPTDPNAPSSHRAGWPSTPETTPPMPFTEWPYGAITPIGVTLPNSVDSPFMVAIANTSFGQWLSDNHFQLYGWVDPGFNVSSNTNRPGGNAPISYAYTPNTVQLDQIVEYIDRFPDTVQTDHVDWGMRIGAIYGQNYRFTNSYSPFTSYQLNKNNSVNGYDFPMVYGDLYIPQVFQGMNIRVGRYISIPDIEAQLAPNNYMYTHSITYAFDNYTNEGVQTTTFVTPQLAIQLGVNDGTEAYLPHMGQNIHNPDPNPLYPAHYYPKDPGAVPSFSACIRYTWNDGHDNVYPCMDGINNAKWGFNNLQWYGGTYYHKFNDQWHISYEFYDMHEKAVPNANNTTVRDSEGNVGVLAINAAGGLPFSGLKYNQPNLAFCKSPKALTCTATAIGTVAYINYSPEPLDNFSLRPELYDDQEGQRTGTKALYWEVSFGWQHWLSPQIEIRPEVGYYRATDATPFNGGTNAFLPGDKNYTVIGLSDIIIHW